MTENDEGIIKILIADDHEVVREGLKKLLAVDKRFEIVGVASNGIEAVDMSGSLTPDIALLDILMPVMDGISATEIIKKVYPKIKVVIFTAYEDSKHLEQALIAGADGYISKDAGAKDLTDSLRKVIEGGRVFSKSIIELLENKFIAYQNIDNSPVAITNREQEILNLAAQGKTSSEISKDLFISERTVQTHRSNIMQKLGLKSASSLIRYAVLRYEYSDKKTEFSKKI